MGRAAAGKHSADAMRAARVCLTPLCNDAINNAVDSANAESVLSKSVTKIGGDVNAK